MNETTFENAQIGDTIWDEKDHVWRKITNIDHHFHQLTLGLKSCLYDGRDSDTDKGRRYFWAPPKIEAPPRPPRKVKKQIKFYVNFYKHGSPVLHHHPVVAKEFAKAHQSATNIIELAKEYIYEYEAEE